MDEKQLPKPDDKPKAEAAPAPKVEAPKPAPRFGPIKPLPPVVPKAEPKPKPKLPEPPRVEKPPQMPQAVNGRYSVTLDCDALLFNNYRRRIKAVTVDGKTVGTALDFCLTGPASKHRLSCTVVVDNDELFRAGMLRKAAKVGDVPVCVI